MSHSLPPCLPPSLPLKIIKCFFSYRLWYLGQGGGGVGRPVLTFPKCCNVFQPIFTFGRKCWALCLYGLKVVKYSYPLTERWLSQISPNSLILKATRWHCQPEKSWNDLSQNSKILTKSLRNWLNFFTFFFCDAHRNRSQSAQVVPFCLLVYGFQAVVELTITTPFSGHQWEQFLVDTPYAFSHSDPDQDGSWLSCCVRAVLAWKPRHGWLLHLIGTYLVMIMFPVISSI